MGGYCKWPNNCQRRLVNSRGPSGGVKRERHLLYSHNCNKLDKTNMLLAKISRGVKNSGIATPSIDMSRPSRDPYRSFSNRKIDVTILIHCYCIAIVSLSALLTWHWTRWNTHLPLLIKQETEWIERFCTFFANS